MFFLTDAHAENHSERIREIAYKLYHTGHPRQEKILHLMLEKRHQLSTICGYQSFAERAVLESLAQDPDTVNSFLNNLSTSLQPRMTEDFGVMLDLKRKSPIGHTSSVRSLKITRTAAEGLEMGR